MTRGGQMTDDTISAEVRRLVAEFHCLPKSAQEAAWEAQRRRLAAALTARCEHGRIDFEQCPDCRARSKVWNALTEKEGK